MSKIFLAYPAMKALIKKVRIQKPATVLFMARDFEDKGGDIALAVYQKLLGSRPGVRLIYCGPIPVEYKRRYKKVLAQIRYFKGVDHRQALELLCSSDIYLFPTRFEGLGITLIEAKAAGCIPVTYYGQDLEGAREVITSGRTGILLRKPKQKASASREARRFYDRVVGLLDDPQKMLLMKKRALKEVIQGPFSIKRFAAKLRILFTSGPGRQIAASDPKLEAAEVKVFAADEYARLIQKYRIAHKVPRRVLV